MKTPLLAAFLALGCASSPLGSPAGDSGGASNEFVNSCSAARAQLLGAIDSVSSAEVSVLSQTAGVTRLYVNASAGGPNGAAMNPWTFLALDSASKVAVSDLSSLQSTAWDLAFKRALIYANDGDGGPGRGGAVLLDKDFAQVTLADTADAAFAVETFFDAECNANVNITGMVYTSLAGWYEYDTVTHELSPAPGTWLVRGARGKFFKLRMDSYYATPSGGTATAGGGYLLEIGAL